jgi:NAD(P)-dependent dehydrogenase (short-subunit alcohol dehydrogenase family)
MATFICLVIMLPAVNELDGKVALITGGAGSIGAATARTFAAEGARVVVSDVDERVHAVAEEIGGAGVVGDAADSDAVRAAVALAVERFGGLDVAFANAGVFGEATPIVDYPEAVFDHVMAVNVKGSFLVAKHALAVMRDGGSLIFNSSVVGLLSDAGIAGYATSKHAIVGLMRTAAREVADRGIRVNSLHPGPVDNRFQHRIEVIATGAPEDRAAELFEERIPLARHAAPEEIARSVLFLASDDSSFVTATTLSVDGGLKG